MVGMMALTPLGLMALTIARAAACAAILTGVILSPTADRVGARSATKYGSTFGEIEECCAIALMVSRPRSLAPASFLFVSCFLRASTALETNVSYDLRVREVIAGFCDRDEATATQGRK